MQNEFNNDYCLRYTIYFYFFRYDNYQKGLNNRFIMKSVFGNKDRQSILEEIKWWFDRCIGCSNEIEFNAK